MTRTIPFESLRKIPLFSELSDQDLEQVLTSSSTRHYAKSTLIFQEDQMYLGFYIVLEGKVKVYRLLEEGKETVFHIITPMQTLAEVPMFVGGGYPAHAEAIEDSTLLFIQKQGFHEMLHRFPDVAIRMLAGLSKRLKVLGSQIENLTARDVRTRLIRFIIEEHEKKNEAGSIPFIELSVSKSLLAARLGTIPETLSRTFKKLQTDGLIRMSGKKIFIENLTELKKRAQL